MFPWLTGIIVDKVGYGPVFFMASLMPLIGVAVLVWTLGDYRKVELAPALSAPAEKSGV
jgi:predicted MFS family arabinose efflux permease